MNLVLVGPPGVGKGTQAALLVRQLEILHISTGQILRDAVAAGTELGRKVGAIIDVGGLVSDDIMVQLLLDRLAEDDARFGWILDGFPRTRPQADVLVESLAEADQTVHATVHLSAADDEIVRRLEGRLTCDECGYVTNRCLEPVAEGGDCPQCGAAALALRKDDNEPTVRQRLETYRRETEPVAEVLSRHYPLRNVSGEGHPQDVNQRLRSVLG